MAKGKRAAALFEVIQAAKEREQLRTSGGGFLTPSWWFKSKQKNGSAPKAKAAEPAPVEKPKRSVPAPTPFSAPRPLPTPEPEPSSMKMVQPESEFDSTPSNDAVAESSQQTEQVAPITDSSDTAMGISTQAETEATDRVGDTTAEAPSGTFTPEPAAPPEHHDFIDNEEPALQDRKPIPPAPVLKPAATQPRERSSESPRSSTSKRSIDLGVDRNKQQINLRLTFSSAAISSFAILVVVVLAFLIGKSANKGPAVANATSIDQIKSGKTFPDVLNITSKNLGEEKPITVAPLPKPPQQAQPQPPTNKQSAQPQPQPPAPQSGTAKPANNPNLGANGKRIVGMQYVLVQSYPDPEDANDAATALRAAGIDATVEKVPWFASRWPCVVGTRAFQHTKSNPEFDAYMKSIQDVSNSFAGPSKFRKFEPRVIGWKDAG